MDGKWLDERLKTTGRSQSDLARHLGVPPSTVNKMTKGRRRIQIAEAAKIQQFFNTPLQSPPIIPQNIRPMSVGWDADDPLPIYWSVDTGGGVLDIEKRPADVIRRPDFLRYSRHAFGIECQGDQQSPAFERRDVALINPDRPVAPGDDVLLARSFSIGDRNPFQGILLRLLGETDKHWLVRQFNPPSDYKLPKADWPKALHVAGKKSR